MLRPALLASLIGLAPGATLADEIACSGVFAQDTTLTRFEETFGKASVTTGEMPGPEGTTLIATTVFADAPEKSFTVYWWDEEKRAALSGFTVPAGQSAPGGVKIGMTVEDVEALNGEPFTLSGFFWDYGGSAGFQTGKLANIAGGCHLSVTFSPSLEELPEDISNAVSGDRELRSDAEAVRAAKPVVDAIMVGYPAPEGMFD